MLRPGDTLARLAGDEFVVLCEDLGAPAQAEVVAERIVTTLAEPMTIDGHVLEMTASVGLAFSGPGVDIPQSLLRDADFAMYQVKQAGGARHQVIDHTARIAADQMRRSGPRPARPHCRATNSPSPTSRSPKPARAV